MNGTGNMEDISAEAVPLDLSMEAMRRNLIAKRVAAGAETPIGHRCSNLVELLDNYAKVEGEDQRSHLERNIRRQMTELAGL
jgi:hypothetical protein